MRALFGALSFFTLLTVAGWLYYPTLYEGRPFFYHEDEAHHFNRTVEMVKRGSLDPQYFHKPSLHFYLRMPFVLLGLWLEGDRPTIAGAKKIVTRDEFGLARYSFSWSHPRVVYSLRLVSLVFTIATIILTYIVARQLTLSVPSAFLAMFLISISQELFRYGSYIGVDVPMMFFALLATSLAIFAHTRGSVWAIMCSAIAAGCAVSTKYNAAPIMAVPLITCFSHSHLKRIHLVVLSTVVPWLVFFATSPYILLSWHTFYSQVSYEVWHYAVAGHEGHSAERGWPQVVHYLTWFSEDGLGLTGAALLLPGVIALIGYHRWRGLICIIFPLLFFVLMCAQKTNFVRNMIPAIPFAALSVAALIDSICYKQIRYGAVRSIILISLAAVIIVDQLPELIARRSRLSQHTDTRIELEHWLQNRGAVSDVAIEGALQPQQSLRAAQSVSIFKSLPSPEELWDSGFEFLVVGEHAPGTSGSLELIREIDGGALPMRVVQNPRISIYRINRPNQFSTGPQRVILSPSAQPPIEGHYWITKRRAELFLADIEPEKDQLIELEIMSPWSGQAARFSIAGLVSEIHFDGTDPGEWLPVQIRIPADSAPLIAIEIGIASSPQSRQLSTDPRRLGLALRLKSIEKIELMLD
jgi:hypothetical protein